MNRVAGGFAAALSLACGATTIAQSSSRLAQSVNGDTNAAVEDKKPWTKFPSILRTYQLSEMVNRHIDPRLPPVFVWGNNAYGVADPTRADLSSISPRMNAGYSHGLVKALQGIRLRDMALAQKHAAAVDQNGNLYQWGAWFHSTPKSTDLSIQDMQDRDRVPLQSENASAYQDSRSPVASRSSGEPQFEAHQPVQTLSGYSLKRVACSEHDVFALSQHGQVFTLHANAQRQREERQGKPLAMPLGKEAFWREKVVEIGAGLQHVVALTNYGRVFAAACSNGKAGNASGQLGRGHLEPVDPFRMQLVGDLKDVKVEQIACGDEHTLVRTKDGRVFGWGSNILGQLAIPAVVGTNLHPHPQELVSLSQQPSLQNGEDGRSTPKFMKPGRFVHIAASGSTCYFVRDSPDTTEVFSCGFGQFGQLGCGKNMHLSNKPCRVKALSHLREYDEHVDAIRPVRISQLVAGPNHAFAVLQNRFSASDPEEYGQDVLSWGSNLYGECLQKPGTISTPSNAQSTTATVADTASIARLQFMQGGSNKEGEASRSWWNVWNLWGKGQDAKVPPRRIACGHGTTAFY